MPYANGVKKFFVLNLFVSTLIMGLSFINPIIYKRFIEDVILNRNTNKMISIIIAYIAVFSINVLLDYLHNYANNKLINRVTFRVKYKIWRGFYKIKFSDYASQSIGDLKMRLEDDTKQISIFATTQTIDYLISYVTIIVCLILIITINLPLALFSAFAIPFTFWLDNILSKKEKVLNDSNRENDQKMSSWLLASIRSWREVKALDLKKRQEIIFVKYIHKFALYFGIWINYWVLRVLIIPKIKDEFFMKFGLYFIGGLLIMKGNLQIGDLFVFIMYYQMLSDNVKNVSTSDAELQSSMPYSDRVLEELNKTRKSEVSGEKFPDNSNTITFEHVSFKYPNSDKFIIDDINFSILKGERVAIVGKSGCGKTTLLNLMVGMLTPELGQVLFSGENINSINMKAMHSRIGLVMQENILFNTSIRENLLYGKDNATEKELVDACSKACIYDFIKSLPDGFDTIIGENGIKLSGGQRQRIVLARLFLRNVEIFIFDEATSALDQYSEKIVQDAITSITSDKTIIVVAHRESAISFCNRRIQLG